MSQPLFEQSPQRAQMIDPSMIRTLDYQIRAIWPQELPFLLPHALKPGLRILDAGCGTGEFTVRAAAAFPEAEILGVELEAINVAYAQPRVDAFAPRVQIQQGDLFNLPFADASFDLTVCRHVLQSIPNPHLAVDALIRVTRPGGRLHLLVEDYGMMFFGGTTPETDRFWTEVVLPAGQATKTDLHVGRHTWTLLKQRGLEDVQIHYIHIDPSRTPRAWIAGIWTAWRDGYVDFLAAHSGRSAASVRASFDDMIACIERDDGFALWLVPILTARVPERAAPQ